jgi:hypothetical protein
MKNTLQNIAKVFAFTIACNRLPKTNESIGWGLNGWDVYADTFNQFMDQHPKTKKFKIDVNNTALNVAVGTAMSSLRTSCNKGLWTKEEPLLEVGIKKTERTPIYKPYAEVLKRLGFVTY